MRIFYLFLFIILLKIVSSLGTRRKRIVVFDFGRRKWWKYSHEFKECFIGNLASIVTIWVRRLQVNHVEKEETEFNDRLYSGRPSALVNKDEGKQIAILNSARRHNTTELFERYVTPSSLLQPLGYSKICAKWVFKMLLKCSWECSKRVIARTQEFPQWQSMTSFKVELPRLRRKTNSTDDWIWNPKISV